MRRSTDGSGITASPSRPHPDGDEYVSRLKDKVQLQAKELHALQTQLDEAHEYSYVCETRLRELAPSIELPVSAETPFNHATCRGEPTHVLSTIARCTKSRLDAENRANKLDSARHALEQKCALQHNSLRELRSSISIRDRELSTLRRRCSTLESQNEKLRQSSAALSTKLAKLEYTFVSRRAPASSRPASHRSRDADILLRDARDELSSLREQLDVSEKRRIELERRVKRIAASKSSTPRFSRRGTTSTTSTTTPGISSSITTTGTSDGATERDALRAECRYIIDEADRRVRELEAELASTTADKEDLICMLGDMRDEKDASAREMEELVRENASLKRAVYRYDGPNDAHDDAFPSSSANEQKRAGVGVLGAEIADETNTPASLTQTEPPRVDAVDMGALLEVESQLARFKKLKADQEAQILHLRALQVKDGPEYTNNDHEGMEDHQQQQQHGGNDDIGSDEDALKDILMQMQRTPNRS